MKIKKETLIRSAVLFLGIINNVLVLAGKEILPIESEELQVWIAGIWTAGASLWAWWKNNSFTKKALAADAAKDFHNNSLNQLLDDVQLCSGEDVNEKNCEEV